MDRLERLLDLVHVLHTSRRPVSLAHLKDRFDDYSDGSDDATLWFKTPTSRLLILAGQVLLWILAIIYLLRVRVVSDERRTL